MTSEVSSFNPINFTRKTQNLPDFIIIGGMKCGTTSLHYYLNCHPEISMSTEKELNFFVAKRNWHKGLDWYQSHFVGRAKIYGETSPLYSTYPHWPETPELMYRTIPDAKLIYLVRDPIERMISQYVHKYADGGENRTCEKAIADFADNPYNFYLCRSRYYLQLEQYLQYFSPTKILVISTEELAQFPQTTLTTVCQFLGVSDRINMIQYHKKLHKSVYKRRNTSLGKRIAKLPIMAKMNELPPKIRYHAQKLIYFPFSTAVNKPQLSEDLKMRLIDFLRDDIEKLRTHTGKSFKEWCI